MPFETANMIGSGGVSGALFALVEADGSRTHAHARLLRSNSASMRDVADMLHIACMLHGRHPGVVDQAADHTLHDGAAAWLAEAAAGFALERQWLARLVAATGPLPSTPGQAESEAAVTAQRHALDMLAQSDRVGCAMGAAAALVIDWHATRAVLDHAATRMGITPETARLPQPFETALVIDGFAEAPAIERATLFGAQQLLAQQRGLWALLEARASARNHG